MQNLLNRLNDCGMTVARHQNAETEIVVDVFVTVDVADLASVPFLDEDGIGLVSPVVTRDTERKTFPGAPVRLGGFRRTLFVGGDFFP
ncbi:MAG: hypothetical protein WB949_05390 [Candidatus Acidiferrales bacterium]